MSSSPSSSLLLLLLDDPLYFVCGIYSRSLERPGPSLLLPACSLVVITLFRFAVLLVDVVCAACCCRYYIAADADADACCCCCCRCASAAALLCSRHTPPPVVVVVVLLIIITTCPPVSLDPPFLTAAVRSGSFVMGWMGCARVRVCACALRVCMYVLLLLLSRTHAQQFFFFVGSNLRLTCLSRLTQHEQTIDTTRKDERGRLGSTSKVSRPRTAHGERKKMRCVFLRWLGLTPKGSEISRCLFMYYFCFHCFVSKHFFLFFFAVFILIVLQRPPKCTYHKRFKYFFLRACFCTKKLVSRWCFRHCILHPLSAFECVRCAVSGGH